MLVTFRNFYDSVCRFDPEDFSGRQTAYTDDFVYLMPCDSGARKLHDEVLALHERTEKLVLEQRDYWNGPGESSDFRFLVVENVPAYKDGGEHGFDMGIWLPDMLSCVETLDPFYADEEDEDATEDEDESGLKTESDDDDVMENKDESGVKTERADTASHNKGPALHNKDAKKYFFPDKAQRQQLDRDLNALGDDIKALMQRIGV